jgi:hypothetical protein
LTRDLAGTARRCRALKKEADSAQTELLAIQSVSWRSGGCGAADAAPIKQENEETPSSACAHLHAKIASLEKERAELREALAVC